MEDDEQPQLGRRPSSCLSYVLRESLFAGFQRVHGMRAGAPTWAGVVVLLEVVDVVI